MRVIKKILIVVVVAAVVVAAVVFGPRVYRYFFEDNTTQWVSERFSEKLTEKNEMIVYEVEITGQDIVTTSVWLFGTVQEVKIPYTFTINFVIDLSKANVVTEENAIKVYLPQPYADYYKLVIDEENIERNDFLYPLTPEQLLEISGELEQRLYAECAEKPEYLQAAWDSAETNMRSLFKAVVDELGREVECEFQVIPLKTENGPARLIRTTRLVTK